MVSYETLLDLARQSCRDIANGPGFTRPARHHALAMERELEGELSAANRGKPMRHLSEPFVTDGCHPDHLAFSAATRGILEADPVLDTIDPAWADAA